MTSYFPAANESLLANPQSPVVRLIEMERGSNPEMKTSEKKMEKKRARALKSNMSCKRGDSFVD